MCNSLIQPEALIQMFVCCYRIEIEVRVWQECCPSRSLFMLVQSPLSILKSGYFYTKTIYFNGIGKITIVVSVKSSTAG